MAERIYRCTECLQELPKDKLVAKKAVFQALGLKGYLVRSRTVAWLCEPCMSDDPDYNLERADGPDAVSQREGKRATARRT